MFGVEDYFYVSNHVDSFSPLFTMHSYFHFYFYFCVKLNSIFNIPLI